MFEPTVLMAKEVVTLKLGKALKYSIGRLYVMPFQVIRNVDKEEKNLLMFEGSLVPNVLHLS